jgi:hypothetical protein
MNIRAAAITLLMILGAAPAMGQVPPTQTAATPYRINRGTSSKFRLG